MGEDQDACCLGRPRLVLLRLLGDGGRAGEVAAGVGDTRLDALGGGPPGGEAALQVTPRGGATSHEGGGCPGVLGVGGEGREVQLARSRHPEDPQRLSQHRLRSGRGRRSLLRGPRQVGVSLAGPVELGRADPVAAPGRRGVLQGAADRARRVIGQSFGQLGRHLGQALRDEVLLVVARVLDGGACLEGRFGQPRGGDLIAHHTSGELEPGGSDLRRLLRTVEGSLRLECIGEPALRLAHRVLGPAPVGVGRVEDGRRRLDRVCVLAQQPGAGVALRGETHELSQPVVVRPKGLEDAVRNAVEGVLDGGHGREGVGPGSRCPGGGAGRLGPGAVQGGEVSAHGGGAAGRRVLEPQRLDFAAGPVERDEGLLCGEAPLAQARDSPPLLRGHGGGALQHDSGVERDHGLGHVGVEGRAEVLEAGADAVGGVGVHVGFGLVEGWGADQSTGSDHVGETGEVGVDARAS